MRETYRTKIFNANVKLWQKRSNSFRSDNPKKNLLLKNNCNELMAPYFNLNQIQYVIIRKKYRKMAKK